MATTMEQRKMLYEKYAKLRNEKGYTDYEVAKNTGVTTATLTSWKQGKYTPKIDKITLIAKFLDTDLQYFYEGCE